MAVPRPIFPKSLRQTDFATLHYMLMSGSYLKTPVPDEDHRIRAIALRFHQLVLSKVEAIWATYGSWSETSHRTRLPDPLLKKTTFSVRELWKASQSLLKTPSASDNTVTVAQSIMPSLAGNPADRVTFDIKFLTRSSSLSRTLCSVCSRVRHRCQHAALPTWTSVGT